MSFCLVNFFDMESPTKEIEDFENNSLKYLQADQIEKIWLRLRGLRKYKKTSQRLRCLVKQLERGEASVVDLKKNLEYAASVLESVYIEETRMYRRTSNMVGLSYPPSVITALKHVDTWSFDVFTLNDASGDHALKFIFYELLTRYDIINRFKIPVSALVSFVEALEVGYSKHRNPYHNLIHAADVTQTVHYLVLKTGMVHWLTELEIFAMLFAAAVHDYEHTGTTNNFHIQARSDTAILYNDRAVQENHHVSAAYRLLQEDDEMNILYNLSKDDWRELRALVVEMVLATDMSCHFQQIKAMKNFLQQPEAIDKPKALSLLLHTADISHPAKNWNMHHRWTTSLLEEFFRQGDKEAELGLPFSPLCDRKSTMVAQSQIGFIDFIVEPTFTVLTDMIEKIVTPLIEEASPSGLAGFRRSSLNNIPSDGKRSTVRGTGSEGGTSLDCSVNAVDFKTFKSTWNEEVHKNREKWKAQAAKDLEEKAKQEETEEKDNETDTDTRQEKDSKTDREATGNNEEPTEQQPREEEGNKDPGGGNGAQTPASDAKEPETSSDTDNSQRAHNAPTRRKYHLVRYSKKPSYCVNSYLPSRPQKEDSKPTDPRSRARHLQSISLRQGR
ncbi:calcium/calmodulin-dependent 3',5'-cyclic nucleotide phosphodiesterase 1C-like [Sinocyclocheilus rhinocerous]|uniref:calcium/calmodulin-dependent 3',5'-cyclic nucleotide phosphodiesterase 1C-like n=1 Tax=Sinocyclocheilus rhinocerous TaxID=307959 RepID=UPI0007B8520C|nr:PREDICTED: calcium/calmodulin-dependent 3',5'-cyclic nucleotide phosphodiesterase 1C-like [Sinocyclocheilus rhinocerous]